LVLKKQFKDPVEQLVLLPAHDLLLLRGIVDDCDEFGDFGFS
jgi:hypothetical protein